MQCLQFIPPTLSLICAIASSLFHSCPYSIALLSNSFAWIHVLSLHVLSESWFLAQSASAPPPLPDSHPSFHFFLLWLHANFPALLSHLLTVPISLVQSQCFFLTCRFLLSFFWLVCLYLHPGSLLHFSSSLSLHIFHTVSSRFQLFIYALFHSTHSPLMLSTLLLVLFPQPTFSNLFHFADHSWLWSPFLCTQIEKKKNLPNLYCIKKGNL